MCAFFAVDLATGQEMIKSIGQMQGEVLTVLRQLRQIDRVVNLGDLDEARAVANFNQMVATDGVQSARAALEQFSQSLNNAAQAVERGMINYQEVENATVQEQQRIEADRLDTRPSGPYGGLRPI